ncbi:hypothetical protein OT109_04295 [Phycisphaeraceae bacterium D3-23]
MLPPSAEEGEPAEGEEGEGGGFGDVGRQCAVAPVGLDQREVGDADEPVARGVAGGVVERQRAVAPVGEQDVEVGRADEAVLVEVAFELDVQLAVDVELSEVPAKSAIEQGEQDVCERAGRGGEVEDIERVALLGVETVDELDVERAAEGGGLEVVDLVVLTSGVVPPSSICVVAVAMRKRCASWNTAAGLLPGRRSPWRKALPPPVIEPLPETAPKKTAVEETGPEAATMMLPLLVMSS